MKPLLDDPTSFDHELICGIDEVGRGPLAGPVVACAVVFRKDYYNPAIIDSKKLTSKKIKELAEKIKKEAVSFGIGLKDQEFIDKNDILTATFKAMEEAFNNLMIKPSIVYIDGNLKNPFIKGVEQIAFVKGETKSIAIAAASIVAKDFRDSLMLEYAKTFPQYAFEKHKGYGTKLHLEMIKKYGPCPIHRKTFLPKTYNIALI
ncbi:MAG: ribonuclease HII [Proteobacteria bacterium]|nr:ribonuclease HII [Pseudomonadota bacterium]